MQDLNKFKNEMNLSGQNVYVGHRYVPKIFGEWDNTQIYEPLSIVQYQGTSYTSRQFVPVGIELTNEDYWVVTGNYNAQVEQYRQEVRNLDLTVSENVTAIDTINQSLTTVSEKVTNLEFVNVKDFGAKGDGVTDDTKAIQDALDYVHSRGGGTVLIPPSEGNYMINAISENPVYWQGFGIFIKDNTTLINKGVLKAIPNDKGNSRLIQVTGSNVTITGGELIGEKNEHNGTTGEWGHGIVVLPPSRNVLIKDIEIHEFWGDGIVLSSGTNLTDENVVRYVKIDNVVTYNNRRQGITLGIAYDVVIRDCYIYNIRGTLPEAGIDIEPNPTDVDSGLRGKRITIDNVRIENVNSGILVYSTDDVIISNCDIKGVGYSEMDNKLCYGIGTYYAGNVFIHDNSINGLSATAIQINWGTGLHRITNNTLTDFKSMGVFVWRMNGKLIIQNNQFKVAHELMLLEYFVNQNLSPSFILVQNSINTYTLENTLIDNNLIDYDGAYVNNIAGVRYLGEATTAPNESVKIQSNKILGEFHYCITATIVKDIEIMNNVLESRLYIYTKVNGLIKGNKISSSNIAAITIAPESENVIIVGNLLKSTTGAILTGSGSYLGQALFKDNVHNEGEIATFRVTADGNYESDIL